jgi:pyridoxamine 5'-phosphate oxidase
VIEILRGLPMLRHPMPAFDPAAAPAAPLDLFAAWLAEAVAAGVDEPHAMTLSTVDADGVPDARVVVLLDVDDDGFRFASGAASPKARQLAAHPVAALSFHWREQGRQIRVRGAARDAGDDAAARDFLRRSPASRAASLVGRQSEPLHDPADLDRAFDEAAAVVGDDVPSGHRLYTVVPDSVEFWQGHPDRRHRRLRYRRFGDGWVRERLWP